MDTRTNPETDGNSVTSFGQRLKSERKRLGLDQLSFAEAGGVKRTTQNIYEADKRVPNWHYLERVGSIGVDLRYLVLGERSATVPSGVTISHNTLANVYQLIEELAIDSDGHRLPLDVRVRFFQMLVSCVTHFHGEDADIGTISAEMVRFGAIPTA